MTFMIVSVIIFWSSFTFSHER